VHKEIGSRYPRKERCRPFDETAICVVLMPSFSNPTRDEAKGHRICVGIEW